MKIRKLIHETHLSHFSELKTIGVPVKKIIRKYELDISSPHLNKLIDLYARTTLTQYYRPGYISAVTLSLFPSWLTNEPIVQQQPDTHRYNGEFPLGFWSTTK